METDGGEEGSKGERSSKKLKGKSAFVTEKVLPFESSHP